MRNWAHLFHEFWFNFVGSVTGWAAAYYFLFHRVFPLASYSFKFEDIGPILIALLGVTGLLSYTLAKLKPEMDKP
jgi:hypothetical protein